MSTFLCYLFAYMLLLFLIVSCFVLCMSVKNSLELVLNWVFLTCWL